ncbi:hypothetical protein [Streptomyces sp. NPDC001410]|uniref:hypothetical protein n=1 Tax=Streptomyces sp. NPDC001410 TaxID=3364574 RepID=UPI00369FB2FF
MATPLRDGRGSILGMLLRFVPSPFPRRAPRALAGLLVCLSVLLSALLSVLLTGCSSGKGGPFPYARDGVVFGNFEGLL